MSDILNLRDSFPNENNLYTGKKCDIMNFYPVDSLVNGHIPFTSILETDLDNWPALTLALNKYFAASEELGSKTGTPMNE
jgi:hypothetical protein